MKEILLVGAGGFIGSISRYKIGGWILHHFSKGHFPLGTFCVNLIGCFLIGVLAGIAERYHLFSEHVKLLVITGLLGGFTTFSSFSLDAIYLLKKGEFLTACGYIVGSTLLGVILAYTGDQLILKVWNN